MILLAQSQTSKKTTIIPLIRNNVINGSTIMTDEHKSYPSLNDLGFIHQTVCHKYSFINKINGYHTQAVENFNNCLKIEIKKRKGIITELRQDFLDEFIWKFNNRKNRFNTLLNVIKIL